MWTFEYTSQPIDYANRYGRLTLVLTTDFVPVSSIHGRDLPDEVRFRGFDTAEQIALITDNRRLQIAFVHPLSAEIGFVIVHNSPSTAAVARIDRLEYTGPNAQNEIARLAHV